MEPLASLSKNIKAARATTGMTQEEVAHAAGLAVAQYRKIENGQTNATIKTVAKIAAALGLADASSLLIDVK